MKWTKFHEHVWIHLLLLLLKQNILNNQEYKFAHPWLWNYEIMKLWNIPISSHCGERVFYHYRPSWLFHVTSCNCRILWMPSTVAWGWSLLQWRSSRFPWIHLAYDKFLFIIKLLKYDMNWCQWILFFQPCLLKTTNSSSKSKFQNFNWEFKWVIVNTFNKPIVMKRSSSKPWEIQWNFVSTCGSRRMWKNRDIPIKSDWRVKCESVPVTRFTYLRMIVFSQWVCHDRSQKGHSCR